MLVHVVCFKYKDDVDEAVRSEHRAALRLLRALDGVQDLEVGADVVRSPRSFDTALIVRFANRAALDSYQSNPRHVPVAKHGASLCEQVVAVDFEA
jgi:hypothetical protein